MRKGTFLRSLIVLTTLTIVAGIEIKYKHSSNMLIVAFAYASLVLIINRRVLKDVI